MASDDPKGGGIGDGLQGPPREFPQVTPPSQYGHDFTLQAVMELQKSAGSLEKAIDNLGNKVEGQGKSLDRIKQVIAFSAGVVFIASVIVGYIIDNKFEALLKALTK